MAKRYPHPHYRNATEIRRPVLDVIVTFVCLGMVLIVGWLAWPMLVNEFHARFGGATTTTTTTAPLCCPEPVEGPTAIVAPGPAAPAYQPPAEQLIQPAIDAYNATETARYQEAIAPPVVPIENVGQGERVEFGSKPAEERMPSGENVPTSEPLPQTETNDRFGSKTKPVNIQETHQCLHGQIWVDGRGCKNPTPVGAP